MVVDPDLWNEVVSELVRPLPESVIEQDIRYWKAHCDAGHSRPGARKLAERWGVGHKTAKRMIERYGGDLPPAPRTPGA